MSREVATPPWPHHPGRASRQPPRGQVPLTLVLLVLAFAACSEPASIPGGRALPGDGRSESSPAGGPRTGRSAAAVPELERLEGLPYLDRVPAGAEEVPASGVTRYDAALAQPGLNLYVSRPRAEARLMSLEGEVVHVWTSREAQPSPADAALVEQLAGWHHVEPLPGGGLLAIVENRALLALEHDSRLRWSAPLAAHHDVAVTPGGDIWVLVTERLELPADDRTGGEPSPPLLDDHLVLLSAAGAERRRISLWEVLRRDPRLGPWVEKEAARRLGMLAPENTERLAEQARRAAAPATRQRLEERLRLIREALGGVSDRSPALLLGELRLSPADLFHANTVEIVPEGWSGPWRPGLLLLAVRNFDLLAVLDPETREIVWSWGPGTLEMPHQPSLLPGGTVLVFDNGTRRRRSRVLEVEPRTGGVVWSYDGGADRPFYSAIRGGAEGLANGNVLVTDSESGRAFEVTREGELVWEFFNPDLDTDTATRAAIYRMARLSRGRTDWPAKAETGQ